MGKNNKVICGISKIKRLSEVGIALSAEHNIERLLEMILQIAKDVTNADAGIIFTRHDTEDVLIQRVRHYDSLNMRVGGTSGEPTYGRPIELYDADGLPNRRFVTACAAVERRSINVADICKDSNFDYSLIREFDKRSGYKTKSILVVPMITKRKEIIGVIRLANAQDADGNIVGFSKESQLLVESLASQAAIVLDNELLIDGLERLLESLIHLVARAIDSKSPHTGNHSQKIPVIMDMLVRAANSSNMPAFEDFNFNEEEIYEVRIAAWLHDCGKLTTPDYLLEKNTKLKAFFDRIELIKTRFEVVRRDIEIEYLRGNIDAEEYNKQIRQIDDDWHFIKSLNEGVEWVEDEEIQRLAMIAQRKWRPQVDIENNSDNAEKQDFFTDDELENLQVRRGTLTQAERRKVQDHIVESIEMLGKMPFPRQLRRVPEYAGGHHERIDGKGYPKGLKGEEMSIPARMMAVADIFEALTSHDRPYKKPKTLSETYKIMQKMCHDGAIDSDICDLLWKEGVYKRYAKQYLLPQQIDDVKF